MRKFAELENGMDYFIYKMIDHSTYVMLLGWNNKKQWNPSFFISVIFSGEKYSLASQLTDLHSLVFYSLPSKSFSLDRYFW